MSLDNNCCKDRNGNLLPYYLPWPTPNSSGVNVFAQPLPFEHNVSVFLLLSRQALCSGFSFINTHVLPLPLSFLVYTLIIGVQYFRQEQQIFFVAPIGWSGCLVFPILLLPGVYCKPRGEDLFLVTCLWTLFFAGWASLETCPPFFCLPLIYPSNSDANYSQVKPAGILRHSRSRKGPVPRWTCLWSSKTL